MTDMTPITVAVGRFDDLLARGLRGLIEDDPSLELVAADLAREQIASVLRSRRPRALVLDLSCLRSPADVRQLATRHPQTHIVLLADRASSVECAQMLAFGAAACLAKAAEGRDMLNALHLAARGLQLTPREAFGTRPGFSVLTARECEVLSELQRRRSNAQIAASLHVSIETVRTHARHIYRKLGVTSRRELVGQSLAPAASSD
jgi:DNA-binding NarL/FixJ family response regulator